MKKLNFFYNIYKEFIHYICWYKNWSRLQLYVLIVAVSTILLSLILYVIDELFIWILKQLFSFGLRYNEIN